MSKQEMAKRLIAMGCPKAFNTLRKYDMAKLEMLEIVYRPVVLPEPSPMPEMDAIELNELATLPVATIAPPIPTDAEIIRAARPAPVDSVVVHQVGNRWLALALTPFTMLRAVFGL